MLGGRGWVAVGLLGLVACTTEPPTTPPPDEVLDSLREMSAIPVLARSEDGVVRSVSMLVALPGTETDDPANRVLAFLDEQRAVFGLEDPYEELLFSRERPQRTGGYLMTFDRLVNGVPLLGGEITVHVDIYDRVRFVSARVVADLDVDPTPSSTPESAATAASVVAPVVGEPALVVANLGLYGAGRVPSELAWRVPVGTTLLDSRDVVVSDATGVVLLEIARVATARSRRTFTGNNRMCNGRDDTEVATLWLDESGPVEGAMPDAEGTTGHELAGRMWQYFQDRFGRDSYDDQGAMIRTYVHLCSPITIPAETFAAWCPRSDCGEGEGMLFSDRMVAIDVFGHEFTHAINQFEGELGLLNQPGALSEAVGDQFGAFVDDGERWTIGETTFGGVVRRLSYERHMSNYLRVEEGNYARASNDFGHVHTNAGIPNYATYLTTEGGTHPESRIAVEGIGVLKMEQIVYTAFTEYTQQSTDFLDWRDAMREATTQLIEAGVAGISWHDCGSVLNGFAAVGLGQPDRDYDCWDDVADNCPDHPNPDQAAADAENGCMASCLPDGDDCAADDECCAPSVCVDGQCAPPPAACGPAAGPCSGSGPSFDDECCDALICVVGACQASGPRERTPCTGTSCALGLACRPVSSATAAPTCCARAEDYCIAKEDCCGLMDCVANRCVGRTSGQDCLIGDCAGTSFCNADGRCN